MTELEQYYNETFRAEEAMKKAMPEFNQLEKYQLKIIGKSTGFAIWKLKKAKETTNEEIRKSAFIARNHAIGIGIFSLIAWVIIIMAICMWCN